MSRRYLACDLGAESGRLMLGSIETDRLRLQEAYRFANTPVERDGSLLWDIDRLWQGIQEGVQAAAAQCDDVRSISTDSWGVDYLLLDAEGQMIPPTYHYRDARSFRGMERVYTLIDWPTVFAETGIQRIPINTLNQLAVEDPERLKRAARLLGIADGFNYFLSGNPVAEISLASTFQLYNPIAKRWSEKLLGALDIPQRIMPDVVPSGTKLGPVQGRIGNETGLGEVEVVASCSHDTGAAVAAVPATGSNWAYLSSGTWSLMGVEIEHPVLTDRCRELNFTNEIGYGNTVRLLKNIVGLWLVQECRRDWAEEAHEYSYAELTERARKAKPFGPVIDPSDSRFLSPGEMPAKIAAFCRETGQREPEGVGETIRCCLESLALQYRRTLAQVEELLGRPIEQLHIVGGGSKNALLNQLTADAVQIPIRTGPVEATAIGNILVQAIAMGDLGALSEGRALVGRSFEIGRVEPSARQPWDDAYTRFEELIRRA